MQFELRERRWEPPPPLPDRFELLPWQENLLYLHATAKFRSFQFELDTNVFSCLGSQEGCLRLMRDISYRENFVPEATWLAVQRDGSQRLGIPCGTIQALRPEPRVGAIQNIGVVAECRGLGIGSWLIYLALRGFAGIGLEAARLEVTSHNTSAIRLYERIGFRIRNVVYKSADIPEVSGPNN